MVQPLCCAIEGIAVSLVRMCSHCPTSRNARRGLLLAVLEHPAAHGLPTPSYGGNHCMLAIDVPKLRQQQDKSIGFVQAKALPFASHWSSLRSSTNRVAFFQSPTCVCCRSRSLGYSVKSKTDSSFWCVPQHSIILIVHFTILCGRIFHQTRK